MLDELSLEDMRTAVHLTVYRANWKPPAHSTPTPHAAAETGVDYISLGTLTKDIKAVDLSMRLSL